MDFLESDRDERAQDCSDNFKREEARRDRRFASSATPSQGEPRYDRDVVVHRNRCLASRARRARTKERTSPRQTVESEAGERSKSCAEGGTKQKDCNA